MSEDASRSKMRIREAEDSDASGLIALIEACFAEYPGCVLDVDREEPDLRTIRTCYQAHGGRFWVAETDGEIVGCIGLTPASKASGIELKKLYVARRVRRQGLGARLTEYVLDEARARGAPFVDLWSDTRFETAHRFYERHGFLRGPQVRDLQDLSHTREYYYRLGF